jgi:exodeoxyribonuclease V beta subunit
MPEVAGRAPEPSAAGAVLGAAVSADGGVGPPHFDVCGPLPEAGVTILEASAGTGKTYTIAALVARLVAEGVAPLSEVLVVTFTRMATGELRDRARERLVSAEAGLARVLDAGEQPPADDAVLCLLAGGDRAVTTARRQRLADALAAFDTATITTTHGFCHAVLSALGTWGELAPGAALLEDPTDLVEEVVDDLLTRRALTPATLPFRRKAAVQAASMAVNNPETPLDPAADPGDGSPDGLRRRLAHAVRGEVERRLLDGNLLTYDDLLVRLARALDDEERGPNARCRLRQRYRVVLVDEFQDTDSVQWQVVRRAFGDGATRLVLIGDPKQAVYSFRGADVYAYLDAVRTAGPGHRFTLGQNWRSDAALLAAYDALFEPLHLGHHEIVYRRGQATRAHRRPGLEGAPVPSPLRARVVRRSDGLVTQTTRGLLQKDAATRFVAEDAAADIAQLLGSGAHLVCWGDDEGAGVRKPVTAGDIGVLVRTNRQALVVQSALRAAAVPVVVAGAQSVLSTTGARHWLGLLEALEHPASRSLAAAAALTPFMGMRAEDLAGADEKGWEEVHARLHEWSALVRRSGVAALFWHITATEGLPARLLSIADGERQLTDLGHVAELLHTAGARGQLGLAALRTWLARRIDEEASDGTEAEQRSRRLDSDAAAVQVLTVHRAKGLEFPVVYCPFLWDAGWRDHAGDPVVFHDRSEARKLDVGGQPGGAIYSAHYLAARAERRGEDLRHLYVALTRAKHQAVIWWAGAQDCQRSALGRLLLSRDAAGDVSPSGRSAEPRDEQVEAQLDLLARRAPGLISVEGCGPRPRAPLVLEHPPAQPATMWAAPFVRDLDLAWRRSSYTSVTAGAHFGEARRDRDLDGALVSSEPERHGTSDEPATGVPATGAPATGGVVAAVADVPGPRPGPGVGARQEAVRSLMDGVPAGAEVGTWVHRVLERADFAASPLLPALVSAVGREQPRYGGQPGEAELLARGLEAAILTPLGHLVPGARLRDLDRGDRLDELGFELPLAGGDAPNGEVLLVDLAALLADHIPTGQPLAGYAASLAGPELETNLRGYLTGSLDLVFRWPVEGERRYFVADYKTNWLAPAHEQLTTWHYRPEALEAEMVRAHYPLQAIFYLVALHRYLRWRQPGYDPEVHLGGALYLFLRGMAGPATPVVGGQTCGVFSWRPPVGLVAGLSDLLAGTSGGGLGGR